MDLKKNNLITQTGLILFFTVLCVLFVIPFVLVVSVSISNEKDIAMYGYSIIPKNIDWAAYQFIFKNPQQILQAYKVTTIFTVIATFLSTLLQAMCAYPLSRNDVKGRKQINFYLYFTMLFHGGMVPTYILITQYLHLADTIWVYILPTLIGPYNIFMMRTFFKGLPDEMFEAMTIDGATPYHVFFKTVIPLSKPVIATVAFNMFLAKWNNWSTPMLYINNPDLFSLQYLLQRIMENLKVLQEMSSNGAAAARGQIKVPSETIRMAMAVVVAGPALIVFPFFQKYFVRGLTVGSVKG